MDRITPTGWGSQKGEPVQQLGSLRAVLERMLDGGTVIVGSLAQIAEGEAILREIGLARHRFVFVTAAAGTEPLYRLPQTMPIGVAPDAFAAVPAPMWADISRVLSARFPTVLWG